MHISDISATVTKLIHFNFKMSQADMTPLRDEGLPAELVEQD
jgi:hypothetical protein